MRLTATMTGFDALSLKAKYLVEAAQRGLAFGVAEAALLMETSAKLNAPVKTGALRDSIATTKTVDTPETQVAVVAPDTPYARRIELGFSGSDSLGRVYDQAPKPYMRPAFDENRSEAVERIKDSVREEVIGASVQAGARRTRG